MKNLLLFLAVTSALIFSSCEGDPGPPGPQGEPGINILGQVFEVNVNFQYNPDTGLQEALVNFPSTVFRIAVVPSEFATDGISMETLLEELTIDQTEIITIDN